MGDSKIEWTEKTWNPVTGCSKVSQGCKHCYAERIFQRPYPGRDFTDVRTHEDRLDAPLHWRKPSRIFVNSMSDLFHEKVPFEFIDAVRQITFEAKQHTFQILTKRPERMLTYWNWSYEKNLIPEWPSNVWLGVSVEDQKTADERIPLLLQTPAAVRWISAEPLLGPIDIRRYLWCGHKAYYGDVVCPICGDARAESAPLDWVVTGGESGPGARPTHPDWARSLRDQCVTAGVPFFFKQWGEHVSGNIITDESFYGGARVDVDGHGQSAIAYAHNFGDGIAAVKVGKGKAGRVLDGRTWDEYPKISEAR